MNCKTARRFKQCGKKNLELLNSGEQAVCSQCNESLTGHTLMWSSIPRSMLLH